MNTYGQQPRQRIHFYGMALSLFLWVSALFPLAPHMPAGIPNLSPAEQKQFETEMAAFQEEFNKMSPQEQESFYQSREEAVHKIEDLSQTEEGKELLGKLDRGEISDTELDQLINRLAGEEPKEEKAVEKEPEVELEEIKPAPKPPVVLSSKEEQAIDMISTLIIDTDSFLVKAAAVPELPGHIKQWTKKGKISWAGTTQNWADLKEGIEKLIAQLNSLLEQDSKTGVYYHIDELIKHETLYNNMRKVATVVSTHEPQVMVETSPLHKINKASRIAIQKLINQYIEALYVLKLKEEIATLMKKFDPKAQAAREAEAKAAKAAELASKREQVAPGRPIVTGRPEEPMYTPLYEYPERQLPRTAPKTYIPAAPSRAYEPVLTPPSLTKAAPKGAPVKPQDKDKKEDEEKKKEDKADIQEYKKRATTFAKEQQKKMDRLANAATDLIDSVGKELAKAVPLVLLEQHLTDETPVDITLVTETIPDAQRDLSVRRGVQGKIEELRETIRTPRARKQYQDRLKKQYDVHKKTFETIEKQISAIEQKFDTFKESIPAEKLYAYFGLRAEARPITDLPDVTETEKTPLPYEAVEKKLDEIAQEAKTEEEGIAKAIAYLETSPAKVKEEVVAKKEVSEKAAKPLLEIERKIPTPISLFDVRNSLRELKKAIDEFDKPPVKRAVKK